MDCLLKAKSEYLLLKKAKKHIQEKQNIKKTLSNAHVFLKCAIMKMSNITKEMCQRTSFFIIKEVNKMSKIMMIIAIALSVANLTNVSADEWKKMDYSGLNIIQETIESAVDGSHSIANSIVE